MVSLPTAHSSQTFGSKPIDFYSAPGQVVGSDPRARADERRIQDNDGARHAIRLADSHFKLEPGDAAAVLRLQPGPARQSRPVAVINYATGSWTRTAPEASQLLAKAGVARNANWAFSFLFLLAAMIAVLWPELRVFLTELFPATFSALPAFDAFALAARLVPALSEWRLSESTASLTAPVEQAVPMLAGQATTLMFAGAALLGALVAFAARSWRLLWVPFLVVAIGAGAIGLAGVDAATIPALLALSGSALVFLLGGLVNRARDAWRLESRIARLADHLLRHPPEEMVSAVPSNRSDSPATEHAETLESERPDAAAAEAEVASGSDTEAGRVTTAAVAGATVAGVAIAEPVSDIVVSEAGDAADTDTSTEAEPEAPAANDAAPDGIATADADAVDGVEAVDAADDQETVDAEPNSLQAALDAGLASPLPQSPAEAIDPVEAQTPTPRAEDPRYSARDISLPPPPPMAAPANTAPAPAEDPDTADSADSEGGKN